MLPQCYEIIIKNNDFGVVYTIDYDTYKLFETTFNAVYHTKKGKAFYMNCDYDKWIDTLIVDDNHLYELLDDLREQGFCDSIDFSFIDDYFKGNYNQFGKAF